jgi:membrane associated rhomboid family serine protease
VSSRRDTFLVRDGCPAIREAGGTIEFDVDGTQGEDLTPDGVSPDTPNERKSGLLIETCYRHPNVTTGVHCTRCGRPICPDCMVAAPVGYQCPDCARQARAIGPRRRARLVIGRPGSMTTLLLAVNIGMFVVEVAYGGAGSLLSGPSPQRLFNLGALYPPAVAQGHQYWRFLTAMFLHAGLLHIGLNMYALYLFGYLIENSFGRTRFLAIYFISGLMASVTSFVFGNPQAVAVGASGAIFGLLGAWVAYNYRRRGSALASANLRMAFILIALNLFLGFSIAGIDNFAHIGGLLTGVVAGALVEGFGPRYLRPFVQAAGFALIILVGVLLTLSRVSALSLLRPT